MTQSRPLPPIPHSGELHGRLDGVAVRNARSNLLESLREGRQLEFADLLAMDMTQKYKLVDARSAMAGDKKTAEDVKRSCLFLRNKLKHLLHPVKDRPPDWGKLQASFCQCLPGVEQILERIGFVREQQNYAITQERLSSEALADALVDLNLLAEELSLTIRDQHPTGAKLFAKNETPAARRAGPSGMHEMISAMQRKLSQVCDLCGEATATRACQESHCSKRRLCENCDGRWHGHPDRRRHVRRKISDAVGANAVQLLPAAAGPIQLNSGVRKVVSNSQSVSYKSQLGLMGNNVQARPQPQPQPQQARVPPKLPPDRPVSVLRGPVGSPRQQQQPPPQQSNDSSELDARVMKLNEFMMSLKPIHENQRSVSKPANHILRPPTPEEEFFDCSEEPPQRPQVPQPPMSLPTPKPRQSKYKNPPTPIATPPVPPKQPPPQQPPPKEPVSNEPTEANSWTCPTCTALNPIAETKLLKSNRVVCSVCAITCAEPEVVAKVKQQQQQQPLQPVMPKEVLNQPAVRDSAPPKPLQPLSNDPKWSCSACTMLNSNTVKACTMCVSPREISVGDIIQLPFKVKPVVARQRNPEMEDAANKQLLKLIHDLEISGADGRLAQLYLATTADDGDQSEAGFQAWTEEKWPALIEQVGCEVAKVLQELHPDVAAVPTRPCFDDLAAAVLDNACDLETAIQLCAQRHVAKISWIQEKCPELLKSADEVNVELHDDLTNIFQAENDRVFMDFTIFLFSNDGFEEPKFRKMNSSKSALYCLMGELDIRKIEDAERLQRFLTFNDLKGYDVRDLAEAVKNCIDIKSVKHYFSFECKSCFFMLPKHKLLPMASCQCELCHECFYNSVISVVRNNRHVTELHCPMCETPNANQIEELQSHFALLLQQIQHFQHDTFHFDRQDVDLVENKIAEWNYILDPNFRWCSHCHTGLMLPEIMLAAKYQCPDAECHKFSCKDCNKPWKDQHENLSCDEFDQWLQNNDPEYQEKGVAFFLQNNGIQCPNCRYQYALAKGGCEHFTCRQCKFQFCAGCKGEFLTDKNGKGLACKHPRDCLYYLRDYGVQRLQQLLRAHKVEYKTNVEPAVDQCELMMQKEMHGGLLDEKCGDGVNPGQANLCEKHYKEYLVSLVNRNKLDPVSVMEEGELRGACGRHGVDCSGVGENNLAALRELLVTVPL